MHNYCPPHITYRNKTPALTLTSGIIPRRGLQLIEVLCQLRQLHLKQIPEDGHVDGEGAQIVGEVGGREDVVDHVDHHLGNK